MSICPGNVIFGLILLENTAFVQNMAQKKKIPVNWLYSRYCVIVNIRTTFILLFFKHKRVKSILVITSVTSVLQYYFNLELLEEFSPVVERLGFDENFILI